MPSGWIQMTMRFVLPPAHQSIYSCIEFWWELTVFNKYKHLLRIDLNSALLEKKNKDRLVFEHNKKKKKRNMFYWMFRILHNIRKKDVNNKRFVYKLGAWRENWNFVTFLRLHQVYCLGGKKKKFMLYIWFKNESIDEKSFIFSEYFNFFFRRKMSIMYST